MHLGAPLLPVLLALAPLPVQAQTLMENKLTVSMKEEALKELSLDEALDRFGAAREHEEFDLRPEMVEFRTDLPEFFTAEEIAAGVRIREYTWPLDSQINRTIWFADRGKGWRYLHHKDWDKNLEF